MKAAVLDSVGELRIEERELSSLRDHDVLVAIRVCGVCRTDRKSFLIGQRDLHPPRILGHEIAGVVQEVGPQVANHKAGDRVQVYPGIACGSCVNCLAGHDHLCDEMQIIGFHSDGGFAEYLLVEESVDYPTKPSVLNKLPDNLSFRIASLAEPVACSLNLLLRMNLDRAKYCVILGAGPLGIITAQLVRANSSASLAIVEPHAARRQIAAAFSDAQFDAGGQTIQQLLEFTNGQGADLIIPCCPGNEAFQLSLQLAAKRAEIGFFSGLTDTSSIPNQLLNTIHYRELSVIGSYGCSSSDVKGALGLLAAGALDIDRLPVLDISWDELPGNLADTSAQDHIFTFFWPDISEANATSLCTDFGKTMATDVATETIGIRPESVSVETSEQEPAHISPNDISANAAGFSTLSSLVSKGGKL